MKEYTQTIPVDKVRLTKEDLRHLFMITDSQGQTTKSHPSFTISTKLAGLQISEESLDRFLGHTDLPPYLDNLTILWTDTHSDTSPAANRLSLQLSPNGNTLKVSSPDQTWMLGKCELLKHFLRQKYTLSFLPGRNTRVLLYPSTPFWKKNKNGLTLLLTLLSLLVSLILGILQLLKK